MQFYFFRAKELGFLLLLGGALSGLSGCDSVRNTLGLDHHQVDSFDVEGDNPPLSVPTDYRLRPPQLLDQKTEQARKVESKAQETLTGKPLKKSTSSKGTTPAGDKALLEKAAGDTTVKSDIRKVVNEEAEEAANSPLVEKLSELRAKAAETAKKNDTEEKGSK